MDKDTIRLIIGLAFLAIVLWIVAHAVRDFDLGTLVITGAALLVARPLLRWMW